MRTGDGKFMEWAEYLERANLRALGIKSYKPLTFLTKLVGYSLIGIGMVTLPFPCGSLFMIGFGALLLGIGDKVMYKLNDYKDYVVGKYLMVKTYGWFA